MRLEPEHGFSLTEMLICIVVMIPIIGAAFGLLSVGVDQYSTEQSSIEMNQEARAALEMMTMEIAQAGSHGDRETVTTAAIITPSANPQSVSVQSSAGLNVGDYVDVDNGTETVKLTAVGDGSISGAFRTTHNSGVPIRLFALPYQNGVIPPAGLGANASASVTTLRFFGDILGDGNVNYVEYVTIRPTTGLPVP